VISIAPSELAEFWSYKALNSVAQNLWENLTETFIIAKKPKSGINKRENRKSTGKYK
jgi:hypothetical protein